MDYQLKNKAKISEQKRQYQLRNIDKLKEYNKVYSKQWRIKNKLKIQLRNKEYYIKENNKIVEYRKKYHSENKDKINAKNREYIRLNKDKRKAYVLKNKDKLLKQRREHSFKNKELRNAQLNNRYKEDIIFRITVCLRTRVYKALKGNYKNTSVAVLIWCSIEYLKDHLKSKFQDGMTLDNHGKWHIDHIQPCASFDLSIPEQQKKCFHYTNLQPLWAKDNISKGAKIN